MKVICYGEVGEKIFLFFSKNNSELTNENAGFQIRGLPLVNDQVTKGMSESVA